MAKYLFSSMGMQVNPLESHAVNIEKENLTPKLVTLLGSFTIPSIEDTDRIKYLGINF
jgi:hypothetical protein